MKTEIFHIGCLVTLLFVGCLTRDSVHAAQNGTLVKTSDSPSVYYVYNNQRHAFPNEKTYYIWYSDFSQVQTISASELASYPLGKNITYRPNVRLIKVNTDPKVYAVSRCGTLHWITSEQLAIQLWGTEWNRIIDDLPDTFFTNYTVGNSYTTVNDYLVDPTVKTIGDNLTCGAVPLTASPSGASIQTATGTTPGTIFSSTTSTGSGSSTSTSVGAGGVTATTTTTIVVPSNQQVPDLGINASLHGKLLFESDNYWNQDISNAPIDPNSAALIAKIGANDPLGLIGASTKKCSGCSTHGKYTGIGYIVVDSTQPFVSVINTLYKSLNDFTSAPIPAHTPIEDANTDHHAIVLDRDNWKLYEFWKATPVNNGQSWDVGTNILWDLTKYKSRPDKGGSADAAGLPIFPGLVRYDEVVEQKEIKHALRFLIRDTSAYYVYPATKGEPHTSASDPYDPTLPPMGMRVRLKANVDISSQPSEIQVVLTALKKYGMILADHTDGLDWSISATQDTRWDSTLMSTLNQSGITGNDFEVIQMGSKNVYP